MPIGITTSGSFKNLEKFLRAMQRNPVDMNVLYRGALEGVMALRLATPVKTGLTAASWNFKVTKKGSTYTIAWTNSDVENGFPVAIMLQYGHGTGNGGFVRGQDYINPAIRPVFDKIANEVWKAVTSA